MHILGTFQSPPHHPLRGAQRFCRLLASYQRPVILGLLGMALGILGCDGGGSIGGSGQCGGANRANACVQINRITPVYLDQNTSNVDVNPQQEICPVTSLPELYEDHNATVSITNAPLPGVGPSGTTTVTLQDFSISYTLNSCPTTSVGCPPLSTMRFGPGQTITIAAGGTVEIDLPFVSLATKSEYVNSGGSLTAFPAYSATYIFSGTDAFNNAVSVRGSAQFTIGNFNYCPG